MISRHGRSGSAFSKLRWHVFPGVSADEGTERTLHALQRYLGHRHGFSAGGYGASDICIFTHPFVGMEVSTKAIFSYGLGARRVVLVETSRRQRAAASRKDGADSRVFRLYPKENLLVELDAFLAETEEPEPGGDGPQPRESLDIKVLFQHLLGRDLDLSTEDFWKSVSTVKRLEERDHVPFLRMFPELLAKKERSVLCYAVDLLTQKYALDAHARRSLLDLPFQKKSSISSIEEEWKVQRFLEVCVDLGESLRANLPEPEQRRNTILIVDDKVDDKTDHMWLRAVLDELRNQLLSGWNIEYLDPLKPFTENGKPPYEFLRDYGTLTSSSRQTNNVREQLAAKCNGVRFILVDQLFKTRSDQEEFGGPLLIRGLARFLSDLAADGDSLENLRGFGKPPEIIALSRTGETHRILAAFRAGAKDYVLKSRLLALPAVLARLAGGTSELPSSYHRNFRGLYNLPNETIGLLRSAKICPVELNAPKSVTQATPGEEARRRWFARLLRALPKTDLHVHVGSCMSPEFLVLASLVGLARHHFRTVRPEITRAVEDFRRAIEGKWRPTVMGQDVEVECPKPEEWKPEKWITKYGKRIAQIIDDESCLMSEKHGAYRSFRATLHQGLGIQDHLDPAEAKRQINKKTWLDLVLFGLRYDERSGRKDCLRLNRADLIRIYVLVLAGKDEDALLCWNGTNLLGIFRGMEGENGYVLAWKMVNSTFYKRGCDAFTVEGFHRRGYQIAHESLPLKVRLNINETEDYVPRRLDFEKTPIEYTLASGLRSRNLVGYLEGCEFSGAEHLRHPFLIHLYAQQALCDFVRKGALYVELRGSPDGYVNMDLGFEFGNAIRCLVEAFSQAQTAVRAAIQEPLESGCGGWFAHILGERYQLDNLTRSSRDPVEEVVSPLDRRLPCKVSLIFVGKRHKPSREIILEAAAAAVMNPTAERNVMSAADLASAEMIRCRVVGFDLAGKEFGTSPDQFTDEFSRLSKLHIPLTIHAGENASAEFVEDAILELGARRIGHGLSMIEDRALMARVREERVCIELCPVSNHQTSHFGEPGDSYVRQYPLRRYLREGILVTICTDNPIVSDTNLVKEYFQASYAFGPDGLSLWEALRIIRMGFVASFLDLPERRAMLQLAEQYLFDMFSNNEVVRGLRQFAFPTSPSH